MALTRIPSVLALTKRKCFVFAGLLLWWGCVDGGVQFSTGTFSGDIFQESRSLSYNTEAAGYQTNKCTREMPAMFFQTLKDEPVRGNGSTIYFQRIETCCPGYVPSRHDLRRCVPDCSATSPDNCRNGFCRSPEQCECFAEFVHNQRGACVHTCPIACDNGRCYLNGTCVCLPGYVLDEQTQQFCRPACGQTCGAYQECVAPGQCGCKAGYQRTPDLGCQPVCTPDCGYGKCVGPNRCECFAGYMKRRHRNVCEAECYINCENGFCESRYKCQCREGYSYDQNTTSCLPNCGDACENGVCVAAGVCRCFDGYESLAGRCVPVCEGGCGQHGHCIEPHQCACGQATQYCTRGNCTAAGKCHCPAGLTYFVDKCVQARSLEYEVSTYNRRAHYSEQLNREFEALIGHLFHF